MVTSIVAQKPIAVPVIYTAEDQIATYGAAARARLLPKFQAKGVAYPPQRLTMVVIKSTNELMLLPLILPTNTFVPIQFLQPAVYSAPS